jgi:hypothetical protein
MLLPSHVAYLSRVFGVGCWCQADDAAGEPGCSLLRAVEQRVMLTNTTDTSTGSMTRDSEQIVSETLFIILHLNWEPVWRDRIATHHTRPTLVTTAVSFARRLWSAHRFALREGRSVDFGVAGKGKGKIETPTRPKLRRIPLFSKYDSTANTSLLGLRAMCRCLNAISSLAYVFIFL